MSYVENAQEALRIRLTETGHAIDDDRLLDLYTLLVLTLGWRCELVDVHDAWAVWTQRTRPEHRSLIPFTDLARDVQDLDIPYCRAIQGAAADLRESAP